VAFLLVEDNELVRFEFGLENSAVLDLCPLPCLLL
jgi:hypothetical protein